MTDGELAVIDLGSAGSMALWKAAKLTAGVPGGSSREPPGTVAVPSAATPGCSA